MTSKLWRIARRTATLKTASAQGREVLGLGVPLGDTAAVETGRNIAEQIATPAVGAFSSLYPGGSGGGVAYDPLVRYCRSRFQWASPVNENTN